MMTRKASKGMPVAQKLAPLLLMFAAVPSPAQTVLNSVETAKKVSAAVVTIHGQTDVPGGGGARGFTAGTPRGPLGIPALTPPLFGAKPS